MAESIMTYGVPGAKGDTGATGSRGPAGPTGPAGSFVISTISISVSSNSAKNYNISPKNAPLLIIALEQLGATALNRGSIATGITVLDNSGNFVDFQYTTGTLLMVNNKTSKSVVGQVYVIS